MGYIGEVCRMCDIVYRLACDIITFYYVFDLVYPEIFVRGGQILTFFVFF